MKKDQPESKKDFLPIKIWLPNWTFMAGLNGHGQDQVEEDICWDVDQGKPEKLRGTRTGPATKRLSNRICRNSEQRERGNETIEKKQKWVVICTEERWHSDRKGSVQNQDECRESCTLNTSWRNSKDKRDPNNFWIATKVTFRRVRSRRHQLSHQHTGCQNKAMPQNS